MNRFLYFFILCVSICSLQLAAQPALNISRVTINWPTVDLYFHASCDGQTQLTLDKQNISIRENGIEVSDFTLWCPDPRQRCSISVAFVFNASASMAGQPNADAKAAGMAFVNEMDGVLDEAAIVWFQGTSPQVQMPITINKTELQNTINQLPANGGSNMWNGTYVGLQELIATSSNPCRAVIVMSDGTTYGDNITPQEIIARANRSRVRIFTIGLGSGQTNDLRALADSTGGRHYLATSGQLGAISQEIYQLIHEGITDCLLTYESPCSDGALRTVDLTINNLCQSSRTETITYTAIRDTTSFTPTQIGFPQVQALNGTEVTIPLNLLTSLPDLQNFYPSSFELHFDTSCMTFAGMSIDAGTLLDGTLYSISPIAEGMRIFIDDPVQVQGNGTLLYVMFDVHTSNPPVICPVELRNWTFTEGCLKPVLIDGSIEVQTDISRPFIIVNGKIILCPGESTILQGSDGFTEYLWSTGDTSQSIVVSEAGEYTVEARNLGGNRQLSQSVTIVVEAAPTPILNPSGTVKICDGQGLALSASGSYEEYRWSNGATNSEITVRNAGEYYVDVMNSAGCWGRSDTVIVDLLASPAPVISVLGSTTICEGDSILLDAGEGYQSYAWSNGEQTRMIDVSESGTYTVTVTSDEGCEGTSDPVTITVHPLPEKPLITQTGNVLTSTAADSYQWYLNGAILPGEINQSLIIQVEGIYTVVITDGNGCSATATPVSASGIGDYAPSLTKTFEIAPNPSSGVFTVSLEFEQPTAFGFSIVNIQGRSVYSRDITEAMVSYRESIRLDNMPTGIYLFILKSHAGFDYRKVIVR